jgi:hypothetical protein
MVMRGEISKGTMISRRGRIARTERVGGRAADSRDRVAVGDFSSRANRVDRVRRGQALVEMTVVGRAGLSLVFSDLATVAFEAGGWVGTRGTSRLRMV